MMDDSSHFFFDIFYERTSIVLHFDFGMIFRFLYSLSCIIGVFLFCAATVFAVEEIRPFPDVSPNNLNRQAIEFLHQNHIFQGNHEGKFLPEKDISRGEFAAIISRSLTGEPSIEKYKNCFPDVHEQWFAPYACYLKEQGIMKGFSGGEMEGFFGPHQKISAAEIVVVMSRLAQWSTEEDGAWFEPALQYAAKRNIVSGILPDKKISRALMSEILFRTLVLQNTDKQADNDTTTYNQDIGNRFITLENSMEVPLRFLPRTSFPILPEEDFSDDEEKSDDVEEKQDESSSDVRIEITTLSGENVIADGVQTIGVQFQVLNAENTLLENRNISAKFLRTSATLHPEEEYDSSSFPVIELSQGQYLVKVKTTVSGSHILLLRDIKSGIERRQEVTFSPGIPKTFSALEMKGPGGRESLNKKEYDLMVTDAFGNEVPAEISSQSNFGKIDIDGNHAVFIADQYGDAEVTFTADSNGQNFEFSDSFSILPIGLQVESAYPVSEETFGIPIHFFAPVGADELFVTFDFEFPETLLYKNIVLYNDVFRGEIVETPGKAAGISGELIASETGSFEGAIGQIILEGMTEGGHEIAGGIVVNTENTELVQKLFRSGGTSLEANDHAIYTPDSRPLAALTGKTKKVICVETFVAPNADVTHEQALRDIQQAEDIYYKNAKNCNCPHFLEIVHRYHKFSNEAWRKIFGPDEDDAPAEVFPNGVSNFYDGSTETIIPMASCTKVFYVDYPDDITYAGESVRPRSFYDGNTPKYLVGPYIVLDNSRDKDGRTLAHELTHHLSGNRVADPDQARGFEQGATQQGNLMNYDEMNKDGTIREKKSGDTLTTQQCEEISWDHPRFEAYPPGQ